MKKLLVAMILLACVAAAPAMAYLGNLGPTGPGLQYQAWDKNHNVVASTWLDKAKFSWEVSVEPDSSAWAGFWKYSYTFSLQTGLQGGISGMFIETSPTFTLDRNLKAWGGATGSVDLKTWEPKTSPGPDPTIPGTLYGLHFGTPWTADTSTSGWLNYNVWFISNRDPVWGDFAVVDGSKGGVVYNGGYLATDPTAPPADGSLSYHVLVPDTTENVNTPELSTWLLLSLSGLAGGIVAIRRRRK